MTDQGASSGPPAFEDPFSGEDTEHQVYAVVLQTREPTAAPDIAERASCDPKTARKYLRWFARLGIVTEHEGRPTTYERNDSYFEWRRINELAATHSRDELTANVRERTERIRAYEQQYGAETPAAVDAIASAEAAENRTIDDVYSDLGEWETARQERYQYERARQQHTEGNDPERASS